MARSSTKPADWRGAPYRLGPLVEEVPLVLPPFQSLTDAAAALGHNFLALDPDGPARRMPPFIRVGEKYLPSLGVAAALMASGVPASDVTLREDFVRIGDRMLPLLPTRVQDVHDPSRVHEQWSTLINYRAPASFKGDRPYKSYEARHLFAAENAIQRGEKPDLDPGVFKDKIVFVGLTASGLLDIFRDPVPAGDDAWHSAARECGRQHPLEQVPASGLSEVWSAASFSCQPSWWG